MKNVCTHCGNKLQKDDLFCPYCGHGRDEVTTQQGNTKFCTECGNAVELEGAFCPFCGASLSGVSAASTPAKAIEKNIITQPADAVVCAACGTENNVDEMFCVSCGARLDVDNVINSAKKADTVAEHHPEPMQEAQCTPDRNELPQNEQLLSSPACREYSSVAQQKDAVICYACGATNNADEMFCVSCGARLDAVNVPIPAKNIDTVAEQHPEPVQEEPEKESQVAYPVQEAQHTGYGNELPQDEQSYQPHEHGEDSSVTQQDDVIICAVCGGVNDIDGAFCAYCGASLNATPVTPVSVKPAESEDSQNAPVECTVSPDQPAVTNIVPSKPTTYAEVTPDVASLVPAPVQPDVPDVQASVMPTMAESVDVQTMDQDDPAAYQDTKSDDISDFEGAQVDAQRDNINADSVTVNLYTQSVPTVQPMEVVTNKHSGALNGKEQESKARAEKAALPTGVKYPQQTAAKEMAHNATAQKLDTHSAPNETSKKQNGVRNAAKKIAINAALLAVILVCFWPLWKPMLSVTPAVTATPAVSATPAICEHSWHYGSAEWEWTKVGSSEVCRTGQRVTPIICIECGAIDGYQQQVEADETHDMDGSTCKDCGYSEPIVETPAVTTDTERAKIIYAYDVGDDGTCCVVYLDTDGKDNVSSIQIPSFIDGYKVTGIGDIFSGRSSLTSVTLPDSVTLIDRKAFYGCSSLTSITLPDSLTSIGSAAFGNCSSLTNITIPDSVTSIGDNAFVGCSGLTSITLPDGLTSIDDYTFFSCPGLTSITIPDGVTSIGDYAFSGCSGLTSITIPDGVTSIGDYAFYGCSSLTSIAIPASVTSIGEGAFDDCSSLTNITRSDGVTSTGGIAFSNCSSLTSFTIPDSVTSIGSWAFYGCSSLTSITIPDSVTSIGRYAFAVCSGLTSITLPENVTSIEEGAFYGCSGLTSITLSDRVTLIGEFAFQDCSSLTSVALPDGVTSIGQGAFANCFSLTSITIPDSVTSIGGGAFNDCSSLTSITLPDSVTSIGDYAFYGCSGLTSITIPDSVTSIGEEAFYDCHSLTSITLPDSVTSIGEGTFRNCTSLTSITLPDSLTSIGSAAFGNCSSLTNITIPASVTLIGTAAFSGCSSLTSITIPDSVTSIYLNAFSSCNNLTMIVTAHSEAEWYCMEYGLNYTYAPH